jgi:hypothetical protein
MPCLGGGGARFDPRFLFLSQRLARHTSPKELFMVLGADSKVVRAVVDQDLISGVPAQDTLPTGDALRVDALSPLLLFSFCLLSLLLGNNHPRSRQARARRYRSFRAHLHQEPHPTPLDFWWDLLPNISALGNGKCAWTGHWFVSVFQEILGIIFWVCMRGTIQHPDPEPRA